MPPENRNYKKNEAETAVNQSGFSLIELIIAMTIILILMAAAMSLYGAAFSTRARETNRTDALTSARAALNAMSNEIANSGYGLEDNGLPYNGIVWADCNDKRIHFRANVQNNEAILATDDEGEDVSYYFDSGTQSIFRYDPRSNPQTSIVVNRVSDVTFQYFDYVGTNSSGTPVAAPTKDTARVRINVIVTLERVAGQPNDTGSRTIQLTSDVTLRNSRYMLNQY